MGSYKSQIMRSYEAGLGLLLRGTPWTLITHKRQIVGSNSQILGSYKRQVVGS